MEGQYELILLRGFSNSMGFKSLYVKDGINDPHMEGF